eukprot:355308-Chlamydomonas_euryale.AAC.1
MTPMYRLRSANATMNTKPTYLHGGGSGRAVLDAKKKEERERGDNMVSSLAAPAAAAAAAVLCTADLDPAGQLIWIQLDSRFRSSWTADLDPAGRLIGCSWTADLAPAGQQLWIQLVHRSVAKDLRSATWPQLRYLPRIVCNPSSLQTFPRPTAPSTRTPLSDSNAGGRIAPRLAILCLVPFWTQGLRRPPSGSV